MSPRARHLRAKNHGNISNFDKMSGKKGFGKRVWKKGLGDMKIDHREALELQVLKIMEKYQDLTKCLEKKVPK